MASLTNMETRSTQLQNPGQLNFVFNSNLFFVLFGIISFLNFLFLLMPHLIGNILLPFWSIICLVLHHYRPVIPSLEYFIDFIDFWLTLIENNGRNEKTSKQAFEE
jgi:hypothetical protein